MKDEGRMVIWKKYKNYIILFAAILVISVMFTYPHEKRYGLLHEEEENEDDGTIQRWMVVMVAVGTAFYLFTLGKGKERKRLLPEDYDGGNKR